MSTNQSMMTTRDVATTAAPTSDVDQIKAGIERTQANLADTVAELQRKLTWSHFYDQTRKSAQQTIETWAQTGMAMAAVALTQVDDLVQDARVQARRNPTPVALVGAGVAAAIWHATRWQHRARTRPDAPAARVTRRRAVNAAGDGRTVRQGRRRR
jgi:hypothetical protein